MNDVAPQGTGERGYAAGLKSHLRYTVNPYARGTDAGEIWFAAYMDGVKERRRTDLEWVGAVALVSRSHGDWRYGWTGLRGR